MRNITLDIWKLIAAFIVMIYHIGNIKSIGAIPFRGGYIYVEFFFMISGYYLIRGLENGKISDGIAYTKKRMLHILPYTSILIVLQYVFTFFVMQRNLLTIKAQVQRFLLDITLLTHFKLSYTVLGWLWYISYMLFFTPIICFLFKRDKELFKVTSYSVPLLWFGYCMKNNGALCDVPSLVRAFATMLLGGCVYYVSRELMKIKLSKIVKVMMTVFCWFLFGVTVILAYKYQHSLDDLYCVCYFFIALVLLQSGLTYNIKVTGYNVIGDFSMAIYITHGLTVTMVEKIFGGIQLKSKIILMYGTTLLLSAIVLFVGKRVENYITQKLVKAQMNDS